MNIDIVRHENFPPIPSSYEECVAKVAEPKADYVISPLAMATLFDWDDEDE